MKKVIVEVRDISGGQGTLYHPETGTSIGYNVSLEGLKEVENRVLPDELIKLKGAGFTAGDIADLRQAGVL